MMEKESSGMYFSGHIIDSYSVHVESLSSQSISEIVDNEELAEKQAVSICGVISSVTPKTTRKNERMAFITVEDRYGEIECLVFPNKYTQYRHLLTLDTAVYVQGSISQKEDEAPKILVNQITELIENSKFKREEKNQRPTESAELHVSGVQENKRIQKIYLRVDDLGCTKYLKAKNIVDIFDGQTAVIFFDRSTSKYLTYQSGLDATEYVLSELRTILGEENVVLR
jgi:DNA polymerase-3 subunit alpha